MSDYDKYEDQKTASPGNESSGSMGDQEMDMADLNNPEITDNNLVSRYYLLITNFNFNIEKYTTMSLTKKSTSRNRKR